MDILVRFPFHNYFLQLYKNFSFVLLVDATETSDGVVMIDSDLPVVAYDKIENKKYAVSSSNKK